MTVALVLTAAPVAAFPIGLLVGLALHARHERRNAAADIAAAQEAQRVADVAGRLANVAAFDKQGVTR